MTDSDDPLEAIAAATRGLLPALTERLTRHGLSEIEVTQGDLRLRVARSPEPAGAAAAAAAPSAQPASAGAGSRQLSASSASSAVGVASPAVGYFMYADRLGPGLEVEKGDALGQVEMLGVRHDVRAPRRGKVRNLVAESGEAVEYGQVVVELEPQESVA